MACRSSVYVPLQIDEFGRLGRASAKPNNLPFNKIKKKGNPMLRPAPLSNLLS